MIPFVTPKILANPAALSVENLNYQNRAEEIINMPKFMDIFLSSPTGMSLVVIGKETPSERDRNKVWFDTNEESAIRMWNDELQLWENISPVALSLMISIVDECSEIKAETESCALMTKSYADFTVDAVELAWELMSHIAEVGSYAVDIKPDAMADAWPSVITGRVGTINTNDEGDSTGWVEFQPTVPRDTYAPGWVKTEWIDIGTQLDPSMPITAHASIIRDNMPNAPITYNCSVSPDGRQVALFGYEILDMSMTQMAPAPRRVVFDYNIRGMHL